MGIDRRAYRVTRPGELVRECKIRDEMAELVDLAEPREEGAQQE